MDVNLFTNIIQALLTLASAGFIIKILRQQIKSQKEQIETMKAYLDVFDPDKVKKFIELAETKSKTETEIELNNNWSVYLQTEIFPKINHYQDKAHQSNIEKLEVEHNYLKKEIELTKKYDEFLTVVLLLTILIPEEEREKALEDLFPKNKKIILEEVSKATPEEINRIKNAVTKKIIKKVNFKF